MTEPETIAVDPGTPVRLSANDMRQLTKVTGRTMTQLFESDEPADTFQALAFLTLRRRHPDYDAALLWERAGDAELEITGPAEVDPTVAVPLTVSSPFANGPG